jgi:hypothetical protein
MSGRAGCWRSMQRQDASTLVVVAALAVISAPL